MKKLYNQFIFAMGFILLISICVGFAVANYYYLHVTKEKTDADHVFFATELVNNLTNNLDTAEQMDAYLQSSANLGFQIALLDEDLTLSFYGNTFVDQTIPEEAKKVITDKEIFHGIHNFEGKIFIMGHFANELRNTVGVPFEFNGKDFGLFIRPNSHILSNGIHNVLFGFILTISIVSIIGMLLLAKHLTRPITDLTEATKQIAQENFQYEINIKRKDEIGVLANSFNSMKKQLQHNDTARKSFINNVSHDFQSPLMNIHGYADLLKNPEINKDDRIKYAAIIDSEAKRLSSLTKQLLLLTSLDQAPYPMNLESYSLDAQLKRVIHKYYWRLEEKNIDISYKMEPTTILANKELLLNVWENLLSNAIKYNKPDGHIEVHLFNDHSTTFIIIKDTGIGISKEDVSLIFDRFYRVDVSRKTGGTGLGLAIVNDIIQLHEGTIQVESKLDHGTTFTIKLKNKNVFD